ncbi:MAG: hypothetical protein J5679_01605 [Alphaproteobacteria bacterium]|nr:hypothetical protein [Alphaproteobacteria bacterium]
MKKFFLLCAVLGLTSCGTIGVGSNHQTNVYNNSKNTISVKADSGTYKIKPEESMLISSANDISITSANKACSETIVERTPNVSALILDVIPGFFLGIAPILVDAISNNLYRMPETYSYSCI